MIASLNGVAVAYFVGVTNALLALLFSFGVNVSDDQRTAVVSFVNAALVLTAHLAHTQAKRQAELESSLEAANPKDRR